MVLNVMMPDPLVTCPLDESHRILKSRMQFHLVKCLKNHKLGKKIKCPWNPLHIIDKSAYEDHWRNKCENLPNVMGSVVNGIQDTNKPNIVSVPSSVTDAKLPPMEEDWDAEPYEGTYDPIKSSEGKPILRSAIGLSKAKKKEWIRQERLRHQQLVGTLPLQLGSTPKENITTKDSCRPPQNQGIANASTLDEFNTGRISIDKVEIGKLPTNLRAPHAPSAGLTYTQDYITPGRSRNQTRTLFDEAFGFEGEQMYGTSTDKLLANVTTEFERRQNESNAKFGVSSTSTSCRGAGVKKLSGQPVDVAKKSFAVAVASSGMKEKAKIESVGKVQLQDEAACFPLDEPTSVKEATTPVDDDVIDEISWRLANLESIQQKIQPEKVELHAQFPQMAPKPMNLQSNVTNGKIGNDSSSKKLRPFYSSLVKSQNGRVNVMPKIAANFAKLKKLENPSGVGRTGHGSSLVDFGSSKNRKSGASSEEKENANPFVSAKTMLRLENRLENEVDSVIDD